jgi:parallel beta-helix repeat protein
MFQHKLILQTLLMLFFFLSTSLTASERMVAIDHPNAQDTGTGTTKAPYKTLSYAMSQLRPGDHLTIAAGTYRDALVLPVNIWTRIDAKLINSGEINRLDLVKANQTTIEGKGEVLIKGSNLVTDWRDLGHGRFVKTWPEETQQVFIDDKPLLQVGGTIFNGFPSKPNHQLASLHQSQKGIWPGRRDGDQNAMPENSFYYHHAAKALYIQTNLPTLNGHAVEVSVRPSLLSGQGVTDITVKNLKFQHANTSTKLRGGLISMTGMRLTMDNLHVNQGDSVGFALIGSDIILRNSSANQCGQLGILARGERMQLINNETNDNNTRGFNKWWEAGGAKFVGNGGLQNSLLSEHKALRNFGDGIWFDWKNRNNTLQNSLSAYNSGFGIHYEASDQGRIINNLVVANGQRGIYLSHSSKSLVAFNLVASNQMQGIAIIDENNRDQKGEFDFSANGNKVLANVIAWNAGAVVLPTNIADNISDHNVLIGDENHTRSGLGWVNMFMATLQDWSNRTQQDKHSQRINIPIDNAFKQSITNQFSLNLDWYQALRQDFKPIALNPEWQKLMIGIKDLRAGPSLPIQQVKISKQL